MFVHRVHHARRRTSRCALAVCLAVLLSAAPGCGGPLLMLPGGALRGEVRPAPADWSFVDDAFVDLETRPEAPYSVELNYFLRDGKLYVDPAEGRAWLDHLRADPRVRVRFGGVVYEGHAVLVAEPGAHPATLHGFDAERYVYRIDPR